MSTYNDTNSRRSSGRSDLLFQSPVKLRSSFAFSLNAYQESNHNPQGSPVHSASQVMAIRWFSHLKSTIPEMDMDDTFNPLSENDLTARNFIKKQFAAEFAQKSYHEMF
jgi:hypothetical protein